MGLAADFGLRRRRPQKNLSARLELNFIAPAQAVAFDGAPPTKYFATAFGLNEARKKECVTPTRCELIGDIRGGQQLEKQARGIIAGPLGSWKNTVRM